MLTLWNKHQGWDPSIIQRQRRNHEQTDSAGEPDQEQKSPSQKNMAPEIQEEKEIAPPEGEATEDTDLGICPPFRSWKLEKIVDF